MSRRRVECEIDDDLLSISLRVDPTTLDPDDEDLRDSIGQAIAGALDRWRDGQRGEEGYREEVAAAYHRRQPSMSEGRLPGP